MPTMKTYSPIKDASGPTVSARQRALAQLLAQDGTVGRSAPPAMPAGNKGLALALANAGMSAVEGMQYKAQSDKEAAAQQASQDRFGRMAKGYQDSQGAPGVPGAGGGPGRSPSSLAGGPIQGAGSSANAATAYRYYLDKGLPEPSARALVGCFQQESGPTLNTGARNKGDGADGSDSIGIGQWNSDRAAALRQFAAKNGRDPGDLGTQLDFSWAELNGPEKASLKRLANTTALAALAQDPGAPVPGSNATAAADLPAPNAVPAWARACPATCSSPAPRRRLPCPWRRITRSRTGA